MRALSRLPPTQLKQFERPHTQFSVGWSRGTEIFSRKSGADSHKASFYAHAMSENPFPQFSAVELQMYPQFGYSNIWPTEILPNFRDAFIGLSRILHALGTQLALCLDAFVAQQHVAKTESIHKALMTSHAHKGRALYYYPRSNAGSSAASSDWCGLHADHGVLTALVPSFLFDESKDEHNILRKGLIESGQGLYVSAIGEDEPSHVELLEDSVAFQLGETAQIMSKGVLCATPHAVKLHTGGGIGDATAADSVSRASFALFLQPMPQYKFRLVQSDFEQVVAARASGIPSLFQRLGPNMTFGDFARTSSFAYSNFEASR
mmetsp:Transcript_10292/g.27430  ORF Transcript_10292/g.27430 Transcript_10292/m.27430 type:complete len:320 (-) Transcript_10292:185-1144(-)